jgi:DNA-binding response OmpR family regulator
MPDPVRTVAIFNASDDTVQMLADILELHGFRGVNAHVSDVKRGKTDFMAFIHEHDPAAVIWDISPPYDQNWNFFQLLRSSAALKDRGVVVTTTHKTHLDQLAGQDTGAIEIIGKPYDLDLVIKAVREAVRSVDDSK